ncbi:hypothetical protein O181_057930 [Austropuccinia psidii MF-1]|uniref:Uncharacterized protein n=1 Tax=Austropuccinia psidii MF-1 TaxID=1389203 RepID=A0A9Q3HXE8_9BASI|nr:hypothetical protein [Austropuccinia psidii MF-1]
MVKESCESSPTPVVNEKIKAKKSVFPGLTVQDSEEEAPNTTSNQIKLDSEVELMPKKGKERERSPVEQKPHKEGTYPKDQKDKGMSCQKEGGKKSRSPSSFYQKAKSQQNSPRGEEEHEKELEETIFPKLQDFKNPKRYHGKYLQHGQNLDGIQVKEGTKNETTPFHKEIALSPEVADTLTEIEISISTLKDIRSSLLSLPQVVVQNKKEIDSIKSMI